MRLLSLLLALCLALPALAASPGEQAGPAEYQVELVLFLRDANPGGEYWPDDAATPDPGRAVATVQGGPPPRGLDPLAPRPEASAGIRVTPLPDSAYQLTPHADALRRRGLTPLLHLAWRQPVGGLDNADWLWLQAAPVQGLVRISLGRYLHVDTDLALVTGVAGSPGRKVIRNTERRRLRSGELHYLDHPGFGLLVLITPHETAADTVQTVTKP